MRRRFFVERWEGDTVALRGAQARHLAQVLRVQAGQQFELACDGAVRLGTVATASAREVVFTLGESLVASVDPEREVAAALFKFDRFEWMLEKATELGLTRLVPLVTRRTDPKLATAATKRVERWRRVVLEAGEQSRRSRLPEIAEPMPLERYLKTSAAVVGTMRVILAETGGEPLRPAGDAAVAMLAGPEGGWVDSELAAADAHGFTRVGLGPRILRCETAAIAALAILGG